jgi:DNA-binding transcriptional MocR family regulator
MKKTTRFESAYKWLEKEVRQEFESNKDKLYAEQDLAWMSGSFRCVVAQICREMEREGLIIVAYRHANSGPLWQWKKEGRDRYYLERSEEEDAREKKL